MQARQYLAQTDFKMTVDYYSTMTADEQAEITRLRADARALIRANEV